MHTKHLARLVSVWVGRSILVNWWLFQAVQRITKEAEGGGERLEPVYISGEPASIFLPLVFWGLLLWRPLNPFKSHSAFFCLLYHLQGQGRYHRIWAPLQVIKISLTSRQTSRASAATAARKLSNLRALTDKAPNPTPAGSQKFLLPLCLHSACSWELSAHSPQKHTCQNCGGRKIHRYRPGDSPCTGCVRLALPRVKT